METARPITPELLPSAGTLLADAFFDNPAHVYLCPDPRRRRRQLEWLLGGNLSIRHLGGSFCVADGHRVDAMGFWTRPSDPAIGSWPRIRAGLLEAPFRLGLDGVRRLSETSREIDRMRDAAAAGEPYWYLNNMVVREALRGSGVGTRLLGGQIERIARIEPGARLVLATQRAQNVVFYGRLGFEIVAEGTIGRGEGAFCNWMMTARAGETA